MAGKFYGIEKVTDVLNNGEVSTVITETSKRYVIATSEVPVLVTDTEKNLSELRQLRCNPVAAGCLMLMKNFNLRQDEVDYVLRLVAESLNKNMEQASNKLWNVDNFGEQTFIMIDDVLKQP